MTYVIEISFLAKSPEKAAQIANAIAEAYISDQLQSKFEAIAAGGGMASGARR